MTRGMDPVERVFCASSRAAQSMDDETFWTHVYMSENMRGIQEIYDDQEEEWHEYYGSAGAVWEQDIASGGPCPICGAVGACGWDGNGLPLIHSIPVAFDS